MRSGSRSCGGSGAERLGFWAANYGAAVGKWPRRTLSKRRWLPQPLLELGSLRQEELLASRPPEEWKAETLPRTSFSNLPKSR